MTENDARGHAAPGGGRGRGGGEGRGGGAGAGEGAWSDPNMPADMNSQRLIGAMREAFSRPLSDLVVDPFSGRVRRGAI